MVCVAQYHCFHHDVHFRDECHMLLLWQASFLVHMPFMMAPVLCRSSRNSSLAVPPKISIAWCGNAKCRDCLQQFMEQLFALCAVTSISI